MSKKYRIRWQETDTQELTKAVKNFNAKIRRIEKKYPELKNALPEKASAKQLKELINTRQDLKRELNSLKRFTDKNNRINIQDDGTYEGIQIHGKYNIKVTNWQIKEINRRIVTINKRRKQRLDILKDTKVKSRGVDLGYTHGEIGVGKIEMNKLKPMEGLTPGSNEKSIKLKFRSALVQSQSDFLQLSDYRLKTSYIKGLYMNFSENDIEDIVKKIENMPTEKFLEVYNSDKAAQFEELYPGNKQQEQQYLTSLRSVWLPNK